MGGRSRRFLKTLAIIFVGHTLICDVGSFALGRFTTIEWWLGIILVIFAAFFVTCLLEKPWKQSHDD